MVIFEIHIYANILTYAWLKDKIQIINVIRGYTIFFRDIQAIVNFNAIKKSPPTPRTRFYFFLICLHSIWWWMFICPFLTFFRYFIDLKFSQLWREKSFESAIFRNFDRVGRVTGSTHILFDLSSYRWVYGSHIVQSVSICSLVFSFLSSSFVSPSATISFPRKLRKWGTSGLRSVDIQHHQFHNIYILGRRMQYKMVFLL